MKISRKIIHIDEDLCDGCGQCVPSCAEGAIDIVDGKARLVAERYCDGLGACLGECPTGALTIVEKEADAFDEEAVEAFLASRSDQSPAPSVGSGCPSARIETFDMASFSPGKPDAETDSALSHWPVQIRLVPANAPFLKGAHLLIAADCAPVAYRRFHQDFLQGKVVLVGCPKFDDVQEYVNKFTDIFRVADIQRVTVLAMEVPCCQGLPVIIEKAMAGAGKTIPLHKVIISARGQILEGDVSE